MKNILVYLFAATLALSSGCKSDKPGSPESKIDPEQETSNPAKAEPEHSIIKLTKQPFSFIIRTGGRIMVDSKDIEVITAKTSGIVKFSDHFLFPGVRTLKGQKLFTLSGEQLADDNPELRLKQIKADLEKASANYERARSLITDRIITQEHFLDAKNDYEKILNEYNNLNGTSGESGNMITSPENGYIREIYVTEGQKISTGQPLASIVMDHNMVLKADLPPDHLDALSSIEQANFKVGYSKRIFKTGELSGKKISFGKSTGDNSFYIPVYFRMDFDPELIEGTFAEVYLIGRDIKEAIVVPNTALMEEYGKLYVFVEDEDGDFIKRYISAGNSDGEFTEVIEGLSENETIVATGAYNIKLSQMTGTAPAHSHNH